MAGGIKNVFGTALLTPQYLGDTPEVVDEIISILKDGDCNVMDTALLYGPSEEILGSARAGDKMTLDTKARGGFGQPSTAAQVQEDAKQSKQRLGSNVDIYYFHAPDERVELAEMLAGVNEVYKTGFFKRFGLSNFKPEDVEKAYEICKQKGYPLPTVYQGNYSPVARRQEDSLFKVLKKLDMAFYAYSPLAGGLLTKSKQDVIDGKGRFDAETLGGLYRTLYNKPSYLEMLAKWESIANDEGISRAELAYRWVKFNSPLKEENGDAIIIGASSTKQLKQTLDGLKKGPLSDKAAKRIDEVWDTIKDDAPLDNFNK